MRYTTKLGFTLKLILSIAALSALGLIVTFLIVNTTVRNIIHDNVIGISHKNVRYISKEIDVWFDASNHVVNNLARVWPALGVGYIKPISDSLLDEYDFLVGVYAGFADGSFLGSSDWVPDDDWDSTTRPWYKDAVASPGQLITTIPYRSAIEHFGTVTTVAKWVPDLGGSEAVVAVSIAIDHIIDMVNQYRLAGGGYLILVGPQGEIISHPNTSYTISPEGIIYLRDISDGEFLMDNIASGASVEAFGVHRLGSSYFMILPLKALDWTLVAVVPASAIDKLVSRHLLVIMLAFAAILVALFLLTMFFMSLLTKNMEESRVTEERLRIIIDNMPLVSNFWDKDLNILECNEAAVALFDLRSKEEYLHRFFDLSPEFQPDGRLTSAKIASMNAEAFETGRLRFEWMHQKLNGEPIPAEVTLTRVNWRDEDHLIAFVRDLREHYAAQRKEREIARRMQAMLDSSPLLCTIFDKESNVVEVNQEAVRLFEIPDKQLYIDDYFAFSPEFQPDGTLSRIKAIEMLEIALKKGHSRFEWVYKTASGELIPCEETIMSVKLVGETLLIAYTRDLRDFYKYKETERIAHQRLQAILDSSPLACFIIDEEFNVLEINHESIVLFGLTDRQEYTEKFVGFSPEYQPDGRLSSEKMLEKLKQCFDMGNAHFEWMYQTLDSTTQIPCEVRLERVILDGKSLAIAFVRDLSEINNAVSMAKQLEQAAFTDSLTGVRNRRYFMEAAEKELQICIEKKRPYSLAMIDIDYFKKINDTYGHPVGDEVLVIVVARIRHVLKSDALVARYGGEEFVVMLPALNHVNVLKTAQRIRANIEASPFLIGDMEINVTISLGTASRTKQSTTLLEIIGNADKALYQAKQAGRNRVVHYDPRDEGERLQE